MSTLTNRGLIISGTYKKEIVSELTVRPVENALGIQSPSFKVFRVGKDGSLLVPRYYGCERFGAPTTDSRRTPADAHGINFGGKLSEKTRQYESLAAGIKAFKEKGGGVLSLPPGYGKTVCALALSAQLKVRTMIVVHKEFLANQWRDRIQTFCPGASIGRVQGDTFDIEKDFVIALIQTMCMREFESKVFDSIGLLIVDEAHHIGAPAFSQFMFKICPRFTLGLTATPERKDGLTRLLYWFLGPEFFRVERVNQGTTKVRTLKYACDAFKEAPPVTRFGKINMAGMTTLLTELEDRNVLIINTVHEALKENRRVLVLSDRREHCFDLLKKIGSKRTSGPTGTESSLAGLYIGGMKEAELNESAKKQVVIATFQLAHEGLDIPVLDTVILATPRSDIKQSIGRIMRETKGKLNDPLIFDIADQWSVFFSMYNKRLKVYREGGFEIVGEEKPVIKTGKCLFL